MSVRHLLRFWIQNLSGVTQRWKNESIHGSERPTPEMGT